MSTTDGGSNVTGAQQLAADAQGDRGFQYLMAQSDDERAEILADGSLEYEEWKELTDTVVEVREEQLNLVGDLRAAGLVSQTSLATLVSRWQTASHISEEADISMNPETSTDEEDIQMGMDGVPLPVFHKDWRIDRRFLMASRNGPAEALDTTVPAQMTRAVSNTIENAFLNGWEGRVDGYQMHGFLNHPDRNQVTAPGGWDTGGGTDPDDIRNTLLNSIEALENDEFDNGDYYLYLNRRDYQLLRRTIADFAGGSPGGNMRQRLEEEFDAELGQVRWTKNIPRGEAVMFEPSRDVVEVGVAEEIQPIEWESPSGWTLHMKIFGAMNLKLRSTASGQCGFVHITGIDSDTS